MAIPKDAKDWTWVLERPCPECGFDTSTLAQADIAPTIRRLGDAWIGVTTGTDVSRRPSDGVWSPLEYACHVRDVFRIYDTRLLRMLEEDDPLYPNWDQDATAVEDRYGEQRPDRVAGELQVAAARLADRFATVAGGQWQRVGRRSDGARFTVDSFARYLVHDPIHHLHDVGHPFDATVSSA